MKQSNSGKFAFTGSPGMKKILLLAALLFAERAFASYDFTDGSARGSLSAGITYPFTIATYIKYADHPEAAGFMLDLGTTADSVVDTAWIQVAAVADRFHGGRRDTSSSNAVFTADTGEYDDTWVYVVYVATSATDTTLYVGDTSNTGTNATEKLLSGLDEVSIGQRLDGTNPATFKIAEAVIWEEDLDITEVGELFAATESSDILAISSANIAAYWPFDTDNTTQADESGNSNDLTVSGTAVFDADHPFTISVEEASCSDQTVFLGGDHITYGGSCDGDNGVLIVAHTSRYDVCSIASTSGSVDLFVSLDGETYATHPLSLIEGGTNTPVLTTEAGKVYGFPTRFLRIKVMQNGSGNVSATLLCD